LKPSLFIRPIHPKTEIRPTPEAIRKVLAAGWVGQLKIHGHRAQIHIPADPKEEILAYNRQGQLHKKEIPSSIQTELRRVFAPASAWNVIDSEWLKPEDKIYVFDFLKKEGESLHRLNFQDRWKLLPRAYLSPHLQTLPVLTTLAQCLEALGRPEETIEGLVFKSPSPGFEDSSIVRCRRQ
jgi:ATP-dependent DNA ligase